MFQPSVAFDAMDGITFGDTVFIFGGTGDPAGKDDGSVPDGSLYITPTGLWTKRLGVWGHVACLCASSGEGDQPQYEHQQGSSCQFHAPTPTGAAPSPAMHAPPPATYDIWLKDMLSSSNRAGGQVISDGIWVPRNFWVASDPASKISAQGNTFSFLEAGTYSIECHAAGKGVLGLVNNATSNVLVEGVPSKDGLHLGGVFTVQAGVELHIGNWSTEEYIVGAGDEVNALRDEICVLYAHIRRIP